MSSEAAKTVRNVAAMLPLLPRRRTVVDSPEACYLRGQLALQAIFLLETDTRMLKEGDRAPAFTAATDSGTAVSLASLRGRRVILYFYPKDETSG